MNIEKMTKLEQQELPASARYEAGLFLSTSHALLGVRIDISRSEITFCGYGYPTAKTFSARRPRSVPFRYVPSACLRYLWP